jgi:ribosomal RNA-processing protein 17
MADATTTDEDWSGVGTSAIGAEEQEDEYSDEEQLATVTVVEDFDPSSLIYGPERTAGDSEVTTAELSSRSSETLKAPANKKASSSLSKKASVKANTRAKKVKYQTAAARKADKRKQLARHTEKAERAGGKQRRSGGGRR